MAKKYKVLKKIRCPYHQEKTPSCVIYLMKGDSEPQFRCFGCGAEGVAEKHGGDYELKREEP